jgi:PAS domain-containing protein
VTALPSRRPPPEAQRPARLLAAPAAAEPALDVGAAVAANTGAADLAPFGDLADVVVTVDAAWRVTHVNAPALRASRTTESALLGRDAWEVWAGARGTDFERAFRAAMTRRTATQITGAFAPLECWVKAARFPMPDGGLLIALSDVTARRATDAERAALLAELQAERAAAEASARWARFLARATESLAAAAGTRDVLAAVGGLVVPAMADFCQVFVLDAPPGAAPHEALCHGTLRRAALRRSSRPSPGRSTRSSGAAPCAWTGGRCRRASRASARRCWCAR